MNKKSKTKAMATLLLAAVCTCACSSVSESEAYQADKVTTYGPGGMPQKVEEGVKKETKSSKTAVEKPMWLIELAMNVFKFFA